MSNEFLDWQIKDEEMLGACGPCEAAARAATLGVDGTTGEYGLSTKPLDQLTCAELAQQIPLLQSAIKTLEAQVAAGGGTAVTRLMTSTKLKVLQGFLPQALSLQNTKCRTATAPAATTTPNGTFVPTGSGTTATAPAPAPSGGGVLDSLFGTTPSGTTTPSGASTGLDKKKLLIFGGAAIAAVVVIVLVARK